MKINEKVVGWFGLSSVLVLVVSLLVFGSMNQEFSFANDFISKLGAKGEPNAIWWNLIGFISVGLLFFTFGLMYGVLLKDKLLAFLLSLFGLGFALISVPMDMQNANASASKVHVLAVCLGLAFWLFGLSRLGYNQQLNKRVRNRANVMAIILVGVLCGTAFEIWSMPTSHRLVFGVVFGWTAITSLELIVEKPLLNKP